ncbi:MAG: TetR/AcrR family transcriptional regulator [Propionicimonas sp.]|uniref:TetR/AcrR family transcriptional regulator n=1 Tax=Propionicimonas sp. TaxID=1955623 RepID=UPI003D0D23B8
MRTGDRRARQRLDPRARTDAILAAATEAFTRGTYDQVSVGAVAAASGASEALVYKYFDSKAGLYTAVVRARLDRLATRQSAAVAALPENSSARDQVRVTVDAVLDHVQDLRVAWASPFFTGAYEPVAVQDLRRHYRDELVAGLTERLDNPGHRRARLAIVGFLGFLGAAAQQWVDAGCPAADRAPLVEAALGALQGALGDWGSLRPAS